MTGMLFGLLEKRVERVTLVDQRRPDSTDKVLQVFRRIAPWLDEKVTYYERPETEWAGIATGEDVSVVGVHACGLMTDTCLGLRHRAVRAGRGDALLLSGSRLPGSGTGLQRLRDA